MDKRMCKAQFTLVLIPTCYVRVVKFVERMINNLKYPFKSERNPETFFCEKNNVCWKDRSCQYPAR